MFAVIERGTARTPWDFSHSRGEFENNGVSGEERVRVGDVVLVEEEFIFFLSSFPWSDSRLDLLSDFPSPTQATADKIYDHRL